MLTDPLYLPRASAVIDVDNAVADSVTTTPLLLHTSDIGQGSSERIGTLDSGATKLKMSIAHSKSNENAPFVTDRTLIRLNITKVNAETAKPVTLSVYTVIAVPQGIDFTAAEVLEHVRSHGILLAFGQAGSGGTLSSTDTAIARVLAGEP